MRQERASALIAIGDVAQRCDRAALGAVKAAERAVRDVVVLRCRSRAGPWDQSAFIANAAEAYDLLDRGSATVAHLSYGKETQPQRSRF